MQPLVSHTAIPAREDDYRVRPAAEPKSWVSDLPMSAIGAEAQARADRGARIYTHNAQHFGLRDTRPVETAVEDVEPALSTPPHWMIIIAGAAVATLTGALLGGFMHI